MDDLSFASWLGAIGLLTDGQRRRGFMCLALAEVDADVALVSDEVEQVEQVSLLAAAGVSDATDDRHVGAVGTVTGDAPPAPALAQAAARSRVESAGCPHCASRRLHRWGRASDLARYRCRDCRRTFNGLTGTPLAHLRKKDRWEAQAEALDHRRERGESRPTLRRGRDHGIPLAPPVSRRPGARQAGTA